METFLGFSGEISRHQFGKSIYQFPNPGKRFLTPFLDRSARQRPPAPTGADRDQFIGGSALRGFYLARFHTLSDFIPEAVAGLVTFSSSPVTLTVRFESVPAWFGNMPPS